MDNRASAIRDYYYKTCYHQNASRKFFICGVSGQKSYKNFDILDVMPPLF